MDQLTITAAVTAGHHAVSLLKGVTEAIKASGKSEALNDLIELQVVLLDVLSKQQELVAQFAQAQARIKELEAEIKHTNALTFDGEVYWLRDGDKKEGPFCQKCYDKDDKLVRLLPGQDLNYLKWHCSVCNQAVYPPGKGAYSALADSQAIRRRDPLRGLI